MVSVGPLPALILRGLKRTDPLSVRTLKNCVSDFYLILAMQYHTTILMRLLRTMFASTVIQDYANLLLLSWLAFSDVILVLQLRGDDQRPSSARAGVREESRWPVSGERQDPIFGCRRDEDGPAPEDHRRHRHRQDQPQGQQRFDKMTFQ